MPDHTERRRFSRVNFQADASLTQGMLNTPVTVLDLSLKGVLLQKFESAQYELQRPLQLHISLSDNVTISSTLQCVHQEADRLGFQFQSLDNDSMAHLRRLIELNLGDPAAAERELIELLH
ncbi:PilZ domain-containing protein [Aurantivibrio plasticivorans]